MQDINLFLLQSLNNLTRFDLIATLSSLFADLPIFFLPVFLLYSWISYTYWNKNNENKNALLLIFYSCIIAIIISLIIQQFVDIQRPENAIAAAGKILLKHIPDASFPSDHASVSVAFLSALYFTGYKKVFYCFFPFVAVMLLSRIIVGVHWPFDVVAGTFVGIIGAYISTQKLSQIKFVKKLNSFIIQTLSYIKL